MKNLALMLLAVLAPLAPMVCAEAPADLQVVVQDGAVSLPANPTQSETPVRVSKKEKVSPLAVEVRLKDGSSLRGELKTAEAITLKTSFGVLKFPMQELIQIAHGQGTEVLDEKQLTAALADFKSSDPDKRMDAVRVFLNAGHASLDPLFTLRSSATAELKPRIDDLLKRIYVEADNDEQARDTVRATRMEARGTLEVQSFTLNSKVGEVMLKTSELASVRWIAHGDLQNVELDALTAAREWTDTGIDGLVGEPLTVTCSGSIVLFNTQVSPAGNSGQDNEPFPFGAVIGKLGPDGEPFLIGNEKTWKPDSNERLYLRVYVSDDAQQNNNNRSRGHFSVRVACGLRVKETAAPASGE